MADKKNEDTNQVAEQNGANRPIVFRKTGLKCGDTNIITIHRPSVIIDSHMHIQSGGCAPLPFIWGTAPMPLDKLNKALGVSRGTVEVPGYAVSYFLDGMFEYLAIPIVHPVRAITEAIKDDPKNPQEGMIHTSPMRQLLNQQKKNTLEIGKEFMKERNNVFDNFFQTLPEYKDLSHLVLAAVVMTMDMEYAHLDGYYGLKIYNALYADENFSKDPIGYWHPRHGIWTKRSSHYERIPGPVTLLPDLAMSQVEFDNYRKTTNGQGIIGAYPKPGGQFQPIRVEAAPVVTPKSETTRYEQWKEQLDYTEQAMLTHPLKMLPMLHFDPRRWQFRNNNAETSGNLEVFDHVQEGGLYLGFKMYTAQGYRPWDIRRLPVLEDFYAECSRLRIPILNHCTPKGAATVEQELYYDFTHPNDTAEDKEEKDEIAKKYSELRGYTPFGGVPKDFESDEKQEYFSENFVSPMAWRNVLECHAKGRALTDLYLCLAHFGGPTSQGRRWSEEIIKMMVDFPNFYADISSSFASGEFREHFEEIIRKHKHRERIKKRVLFGTDWYMTLLYTFPFHGMDYWDYCTKTKTFLDKIDPGLWPRFTMHNAYRFYRLNEQVPRIAESIIARLQSETVEDEEDKEFPDDSNKEIRKEAAWIRQANDGFDL